MEDHPMAAITSLETDNPGVAIIVAAHNAASTSSAGAVTGYHRAVRRIYRAMVELVGEGEDDEDDEEDEEEDD
jgi:hypothetical protein